MTDHDEDPKTSPDNESTTEDTGRELTNQTVFGVLRAAVERLRSDRWLVIPFVIAGVVITAVDRARQMDPIPVRRETSNGLSVDLAFYLYPTGVSRTARSLGAIVDLLPSYLLWAIGLELVAVLAVGLAGWAVMSHELDQPRDWSGVVRYLGVLVVPIAFVRIVGGEEIVFSNGGLIIGIPLLLLWAFVLVRLFVLPVCLIADHGVVKAAKKSIQTSRETSWTILGLVLFIGIGASLLGSVPVIGGGLSTALLAPVHAVVAVILYK